MSFSVSVCTNCVGSREQCFTQVDGPVDDRAIRELARRVDRDAGLAILDAPGADRVEVLEREAERIHDAVAAVAGGIGAMHLEPLADRLRLLAFLGLGERLDVGRRGTRAACP